MDLGFSRVRTPENDNMQPPTTKTRSGRIYSLSVDYVPPVKQPPADAAERARQQAAFLALREKHAEVYSTSWRMWVRDHDLTLEVEYRRARGRSDAANIIGGIADQLEQLNVYHSDAQLRWIIYREHRAEPAGRDSYDVYVRELAETAVGEAQKVP